MSSLIVSREAAARDISAHIGCSTYTAGPDVPDTPCVFTGLSRRRTRAELLGQGPLLAAWCFGRTKMQ